MIDIHSHILPGLDDGSGSLEESLMMASQAWKSGTKAIVGTSHANVDNNIGAAFRDKLLSRCQLLQKNLRQQNLELLLLPGMEIMASDDIRTQIEDGILIGINRTQYYLVEFPFDVMPDYIQFILKEMQAVSGVTPVVAHPERYFCIQDRPELVYSWIMQGCLTQVNRGSFQGKFGRPEQQTAWLLADYNLIGCVASDAHGYEFRTPRLDQCWQELSQTYSGYYARSLLRSRPARIVQNKRVEIRAEARNPARGRIE